MPAFEERYQGIKEKLARAGQTPVLRYWDELNHTEQERLLNQLENIDSAFLTSVREWSWPPTEEHSENLDHFTPLEYIPLPRNPAEHKLWEEARKHGDDLLSQGKVAVLVVAGGQGTRLGFPGPKGSFPVGPVSGRTLFQYHIEKSIAIERKFGQLLPFYIMTSQANHQATLDFFEQNGYFGKDPETVIFFQQRMLPVFDRQGQLLLETPGSISFSPDGHGGVLFALQQHHLLADMRRRGVEYLYYFQVDNVLARIADAAFLGFHDQMAAEMSARTVYKRDPWEKLGNIGELNKAFKVVEYTELPDEKKTARDDRGRLIFGQGSIAIHLFSLSFLEKLAKQNIQLPFHIARKKMASIKEQDAALAPDRLNAVKFEQFIFDAFTFARRIMVLETERRNEFSPIKNKEGEDSPATARRDLSELFAGWLEECGRTLRRLADGSLAVRIEISPLFAASAAELRAKLPETLDLDQDILLQEPS